MSDPASAVDSRSAQVKRPKAALARPNLVRNREDLAFLPAALEIIETPASPASRAIAATIIAFFLLAILWCCIGQIDIVAAASGKIVPTGRTKIVQPLEAGTVTAIHVQDGDRVRAGDILIELDGTITMAERNRVAAELMRARLDVMRLAALQTGVASATVGEYVVLQGISELDVARSRAAASAQAAQQAAKVLSLDQQIAQKDAEASGLAATIDKIDAGLPFIAETAEVREKLLKQEFGNRLAYLDSQFKLNEQRHDLIVQKLKLAEIASAKAALEAQREQTQAEYARTVMNDLAEARQKVSQLEQDIIKAERRITDQSLRAPIDGTVQQLAIHTIGGVVSPAQQLIAIVPADSTLEAEAMVPNKDIGFISQGQSAEIKVDTFNFTKYGLLHGEVTNVSQDAITRETLSDHANVGKIRSSLTDSSEPQGQVLVYAARISIDNPQMQIDGRSVRLAPGMAVTVEIKTGQRRIIEYLLSPLLRYRHDVAKER